MNIARTGNPALNKNTFTRFAQAEEASVMTLQGTVNKIAIMLLLVLGGAYYTWNMAFEAMQTDPLAGYRSVLPWMIGGGPQAEDVAKLSLYPAVVFNYACYTGVTSVYPERKYEKGDYVHLLKRIEMERSFALAVIRAGAPGYVAYVNPRPAGPEGSSLCARIVSGW